MQTRLFSSCSRDSRNHAFQERGGLRMQPYQHLFQPLRLGRTVLKNRIEAAPVSVAN